ncbi:MAG: hypothetical protein U9R64_12385 [Pseudomonadota bacterium]|nr:hypothetical protein [Pseudomonadota bacterium]
MQSVGSILVPDTMFECVLYRKAVRVACQCGHFSHFDPAGLWWKFHRKGWPDGFREARERFYCRPCRIDIGAKRRPVSIEASSSWPIIILPVPDERTWKSAMARMR